MKSHKYRLMLIIAALCTCVSSLSICQQCLCLNLEPSMSCYFESLEDPISDPIPLVNELDIRYSNVSGSFLASLQPQVLLLQITDSKVLNMNDQSLAMLNKLTTIKIVKSGLTFLPRKLFWNNKELKEILLSSNQIANISHDFFSYQSELTYLDLNNNSLSHIQKGIFAGNSKLYFLDLSSNNIRTIDRQAFNISNVSADKAHATIDLAYNELTEILDGTFFLCSDVTNLNLSNNKITRLWSKAFGGLVSLRELFLGHNHMKAILPEVLKPLISITTLDLQNNLLRGINDDLFKASLKLSKIILSRNKIEYLHPNAFKSLTLLQCLFLDDNLLRTVDAFTTPLLSLIDVNVRRNRITQIQMNAFEGCTSLQTLDLSGNLISTIQNGAFSSNGRLQDLQLQHNDIEQLSCGSFYNLTSLRSLDLNQNILREFRFADFIHLKSLVHLIVNLGQQSECDCILFARLKHQKVWLNGSRFFGNECSDFFRQYLHGDQKYFAQKCPSQDHPKECPWDPSPSHSEKNSAIFNSVIISVVILGFLGIATLVIGTLVLRRRRHRLAREHVDHHQRLCVDYTRMEAESVNLGMDPQPAGLIVQHDRIALAT